LPRRMAQGQNFAMCRGHAAAWLGGLREANVVKKLRYLRGPGESYSDVIQAPA
jgi:hypothetical protein